MEAAAPGRDAIHQAIQDNGPKAQDAILTGWVMVAEWMDHDGDRWLSRDHSASLPSWSANGMHHEAVYGDWPAPDG